MILLGIDPGASGAIAIYTDTNATRPTLGGLEIFKMPETEAEIVDLVAQRCPLCPHRERYAFLEKVGPMPKQGISSSWKFAQHYGLLRGILAALEIPYELVSPQTWQRGMGCLSRGDKRVTRAAAQRMWPHLKPTHRTADALLILEWGRITLCQRGKLNDWAHESGAAPAKEANG